MPQVIIAYVDTRLGSMKDLPVLLSDDFPGAEDLASLVPNQRKGVTSHVVALLKKPDMTLASASVEPSFITCFRLALRQELHRLLTEVLVLRERQQPQWLIEALQASQEPAEGVCLTQQQASDLRSVLSNYVGRTIPIELQSAFDHTQSCGKCKRRLMATERRGAS